MAAGIKYPATPGITPFGSSYNDASSVYGSALITAGTNTYDTTDFNPEYPTTKKVQKNRFGVPTRQFALPEIPTGSANLILASDSAAIPAPGSTFTADTTGTMVWYVDKVGTPFKQEDFLVVPISFSQQIGS